MTAEEVEKYINQVAFSGAEEFLKNYEGDEKGGIIGLWPGLLPRSWWPTA